MNIHDAKQEIINTVRAYTTKDENGCYRVPVLRQRPVLLIGPPGIGKTAIVEQAASECGVGLVAYTITHHTRQSAVGLPMVEKKIYEGQEVTVTEYTMSEIIASIYEVMEKTRHEEGILFIDEVNCVSETLAPTMLQLLQGKTFGNHKVPKGWVIVAAGNPPEYNKSVREFDIVTLDRVKKIEIDVEYEPWRQYAIEKSLHGAIRTYLDAKNQNFYYIETNAVEKQFVTARGWEDLSAILLQYESMGITCNENLIKQYIQCEEIACDFAAYYELYREYEKRYGEGLKKLLLGNYEVEGIEKCTLDEQLTITNLLISKIFNQVTDWKEMSEQLYHFSKVNILLCTYVNEQKTDEYTRAIEDYVQERSRIREIKLQMNLINEKEADLDKRVYNMIRREYIRVKKMGVSTWENAQEEIKTQEFRWYETEKINAQDLTNVINRVLSWLKKTFGNGPAFLTAMECITVHSGCMELIQTYGSTIYAENCHMLMTKNREQELLKKIKLLQENPVF